MSDAMTYGHVMMYVAPELMADAAPEALISFIERRLGEWCADHGAVRLEGPSRWRDEQIEPHYVASALIWPALIP